MKTDEVKLLVAIDIGTAHSGYSYSFLNNPGDVICSSFDGLTKTPTSVLVDKYGKKLIAFGNEAEEKFQQLSETGAEGTACFLYRNFKLHTFGNENLNKTTTVSDVSTLHSMPVFSLYVMTLHYLKNHAIRMINRHVETYNEDDVSYAVIVPTTADDRSKWFVRQAAVKAGVRAERLSLVLESEAASVLYQTLGQPEPVDTTGTRYVMVDIGGGVADISVHESAGNGHVDSLSPPSGGKWGNIIVDNCFISFLSLIFGTDEVNAFICQHPGRWINFLRKYESAIEYHEVGKGMSIEIPLALLDFARQTKGNDIIRSVALQKHFSLQGTVLNIDGETISGMFQYTVNCLCNEIDRLANMGVLKERNIHHVIFAGGLAGSKILQHQLQDKLNRYNLVFTDMRNTFAMKGAVLLQQDRSLVNSRIIPLTYALHNTVPYDPKRHEGGSRTEINGVKMCTDNFHLLVTAGTKVKPGTGVHEFDMPLRASDEVQRFNLVSCGFLTEMPTLVTHCSVHREAGFKFPLPFGCLVEDKVFDRELVLGETELYFKITFKKGNRQSYIRYLEYK